MKRSGSRASEAARTARRQKRACDVAAWASEATNCSPSDVATHTESGFARLPLSLLRDRVFAYVAQPASVRDGIDTLQYEQQLAPLRAACSHWNRVTQQMLHTSESCVQRLRFGTGHANDRARLLREARARGTTTQQLAIVTGTYTGIMWNFHTSKQFCKDELLDESWWRELMACFPNLVRLDVQGVELCFLEMVLRAASAACPRVRELVFLGGSPVMGLRPEEAEMTKLNDALAKALQAWHTSNGGLRLLTAPCWARYDATAHSEVLRMVAAFCPAIEYLPTWNFAGITRSNQGTPPKVSLKIWAEFCRRCTKLREFSWNLCELTHDHADLFAATPKPQLASLQFELFIEDWTNAPEFDQIQQVLASVTSLHSLQLTLADASQGYSDSDDEEEEEKAETSTTTGVSALDAMVLTIPTYCPRLEQFECKFVCDDMDCGIGAAAIDALATLPSLRGLDIDRCRLYADAIVRLLSPIDSSKTSARVVKLEANDSVHTVIATTLVYLSQQPASRFVNTTLTLTVSESTAAERVDDPAAKIALLDNAAAQEELLQKIRERHAPANCDVEVDARATTSDDKSVYVMDELHVTMNVGGPDDETEPEEPSEVDEPAPVRRSTRRSARA